MSKIAILCGGKGSRIKHLTKDVPKPLVELYGKPMLQHIIELYVSKGYNDFIFCTGYKGEKIEEFLSDKTFIKSYISKQSEEAGMLQRIFAIRNEFKKNILVTYGDTYVDIDIDKFFEVHTKSDKAVTILIGKFRSPYGLVELNQDKNPVSFEEKPVFDYYIGCMIIRKDVFDHINEQMLQMKDGEGLVALFKYLIKIKQLNIYEHTHNESIFSFNTQTEKDEIEQKFKHFYTMNNAN